jgi:predicted DNA-binding protein
MGRPALGGKATVIRLTEEQRARIEKLVTNRGLAKFIREAVDKELDRREKVGSGDRL